MKCVRGVASIDAVYGGLCESAIRSLEDRAFRIESLARSSFLEAQRLFSTVATFLLGKRPTPEGVD